MMEVVGVEGREAARGERGAKATWAAEDKSAIEATTIVADGDSAAWQTQRAGSECSTINNGMGAMAAFKVCREWARLPKPELRESQPGRVCWARAVVEAVRVMLRVGEKEERWGTGYVGKVKQTGELERKMGEGGEELGDERPVGARSMVAGRVAGQRRA
jgi:hypothetical protein